jgi:flagella basal body P-ring formation protein FlgA
MKSLQVMFALVFGAVCATASHGRQELPPVTKVVEDFLRIQTQGLPGEVSFTIGNLDPNNQLTPCNSFDVSLPPGTRAWGRTHIAVRCLAPENWSLFVAVQVRVTADYLVAAHPLVQGQTVVAADLVRQRGNLAELPAGILTEETQAIGRTASLSILAGRPLRADMLRQPLLIKQNQAVRVVSRGTGFQVASDGKALNPGSDGEVIQVRLGNGQVVSGLARAGGIVEIGF